MRRPTSSRALLAAAGGAVAASLAGCTSSASSENDDPQYRRVELTDADSVDDAHGFAIDVSVLEPDVTPERTARVRIQITNQGDTRHIAPPLPDEGVFSGYRDATSNPAGLLLLHVTGNRSDDPDDGDGRWSEQNPNGGGGEGKGTWEFPSGETQTHEYRVFDDSDEEGYIEPGSYRFETELLHKPLDGDDQSWSSTVWGFTLDVSRVEG